MDTIASVLSVLLALAPYRVGAAQTYQPDPSVADYEERLTSVAADMVQVVSDADPLPGMTRDETLRLMIATANDESGLHWEVDYGVGPGRGDGGRSWCLMQIHAGKGRVASNDPEIHSWTGADLVADRTKCLRAGLDAMRRSILMCRGAGLERADYLSAYIAGRCIPNAPRARARWAVSRSKLLRGVRIEPVEHFDPKEEATL
jgi:hypothetical protein